MLSDSERGVVSESKGSLDSLTTPPEFDQSEMSLKLKVYLWWVGKYEVEQILECGANAPLRAAPAKRERQLDSPSESNFERIFDEGGDG